MTRALLISSLAALALALGGCGGGDSATGTDSAASVVPANALVYVSMNLDSASEQWDKAEALVRKFPDGPRLLRQAVREIEEDDNRDWERDIRPALGDQVAVAILDVQNDEPVLVALVKPDDKQKLEQLLADEDNEETVTREIEGWTAISDKKTSLDALANAADGDALADSETFKDTMSDLGEDNLGAVYVNGRRAIDLIRRFAAREGEAATLNQLLGQGLGRLESAGTALIARDDGIEWKALAKSAPPENNKNRGIGFEQTFDTTLDEEVPTGALAFISFTGTNYRQQLNTITPQQRAMLRQFEQMLGFSIQEVTDLISDEGALYARPGTPFPEATLLLRTKNEGKARATLDRLARRLAGLAGAQVQRTQIGGVNAGQIRLGAVSVAYAVFDGKAVVTSATTGIEALREGGEKLKDDDEYSEALESAGVPDETAGVFYWNIKDTVPLIRNFAQMSDEQVPQNVWTNLGPLRSLVFYSAGDEGEARLSAFLRID